MKSTTYSDRRQALRSAVPDGVILFVGYVDAPRTYPASPYPFRQSSHFLYYVGTNRPGFAAALLPDGQEILYGPAEDPDDLVWRGPQPKITDRANDAGVARAAEMSTLAADIADWRQQGTDILYLPPCRAEQAVTMAQLLDIPLADVAPGASGELARAIVEQRSIKSAEEIEQLEAAAAASALMYDVAMQTIEPGITELEIAGVIRGVALARGCEQAFPPIVSVHGEVLHNETYDNTLAAGDLLLIDSGAESRGGYASDFTRTFPVSGKFTDKQKEIYQVVLAAQLAVISVASPKVSNRDLHKVAATTIAQGLTNLGIMKGDPDEAVKVGAHALFFPHGIGHMIGLDTHDMEDLGDVVGYPEGEQRSKQFGLSFLRLAKKLKPGFVITVEPGIYFVPELIDRWKKEGKHSEFIDYEKVEEYRDFRGIRIEDDVLITEEGCRVLGPPVPKTVEEIEQKMAPEEPPKPTVH